jgi:hypothetical protein
MNSIFILVCLITSVVAKDPRAIGLFEVVKFPNDMCVGSSSRNGTCYTESECEDKGGTAAGSCADGFGVCCIISLSCGETTSQNCTYLTSATIASDTSCEYKICPLTSGVSRIRLDLTTFTISGPVTSAKDGGHLLGGALGDCVSDTFTVTGHSKGSPVICGSNAGQHLFVDSNGVNCVSVHFVFGSDSATRSYDIKVLQYDRRNEMGGPQGCLQYFSGTSGTFTTFNYVDTSISSSHLSNQDYDICIRRGADMCVVCYSPTTGATPASFGLSVSPDTAVQAGIQSNCVTDYIFIPQANTAAIANTATVTTSIDKFCGRFLALTSGATASATICSRTTPFRVSFYTNAGDADGASAANAAADMADSNELSNEPRGNLGFSLAFFQTACA